MGCLRLRLGGMLAHAPCPLTSALIQSALQVDLVLQGFDYVTDGGSFTLTSGITERDPVRGLTNSATVNAALGGFVLGASIEMPRGQRINVVSAGLFAEAAEKYGSYFLGHVPVPVAVVAVAFAKSVEGGITGQKIIVDR